MYIIHNALHTGCTVRSKIKTFNMQIVTNVEHKKQPWERSVNQARSSTQRRPEPRQADRHIRPQQQHSPSNKQQEQDQNNENQPKEKTQNTQKHNELFLSEEPRK